MFVTKLPHILVNTSTKHYYKESDGCRWREADMGEDKELYLFKTNPCVLVWNFKGGVGKTNCTTNLASVLNLSGYNVVILDCDAQINSSLFFQQGIGKQEPFDGTIKDYIDANGGIHAKELLRTFTFNRTPGSNGEKDFFFVTEDSPREVVNAPENVKPSTRQCTISLIPGDLEIGSSDFSDLSVIRRLVDELLEDDDGRTIVLFDCAPQLVPASNAVLFAGNRLLIPTLASNDSLYGIPTVINILNEVRESGVNLKLLGILINNLDLREAIPKELAAQFRVALEGSDTYLYDAFIRHSATCEKARSVGIPAIVYEFCKDYELDIIKFGQETLQRLIQLDEEE